MRIPNYNTKLFCEVYNSDEEFYNDYDIMASVNNIPKTISKANAGLLFSLLYAEHGNDPISNLSVEQFKFRLFTTIFKFGPTWEKRLEIQERLRNLTEDEILKGAKTIMNTALNPETSPSTEELTYINQQNTSNSVRSILNGYSDLIDLLENDVTSEFLNRFKPLFKSIVGWERVYTYINEEEDFE